MTRFAGAAGVESYLGGGPDMSAIAQGAAFRDAQKVATGFDTVADIGSMGAQQLGSTLAADAVASAKTDLANAQVQAQAMSQVGQLGGKFLGGLGSMGGSGGGSGSFSGGYSAPSGIDFGSIWGN